MSVTALAAEDTLIIETPERVPLHFALASIGNRFLACAIDHAVQVVALLLMALGFFLVANFTPWSAEVSEAPKWVYALLIVVLFLIFSSYFAFFEWAWNGQTPGKRWLKLRVIRQDGRPVAFWEAAVRNLLRTIDMMPAPFYSVGLISVFASSLDQRIGDMVAGTVVVREREAEAPAFAKVFAGHISDPALRRAFAPVQFTADLRPLAEEEIEVVEVFLRRRWDLADVPRQWMAWRVSLPILYKIRPTYEVATFTYEGFLEELLARYRAEHRFKV
ncbi:MAG TPA: RDD family protein [Pyrinomonadaceae bacterium]|nr:RDD family protein [Pyrinomonadaceae bacterium]